MNDTLILDENAVENIEGITYEFPYTMHERNLSNFIVPWHWHEEIEFNYAYKGSIIIETINNKYTIHQGEAYFINTNVTNTKRKAERETISIEHAHLFHPILLAGHYRSIYETKYLKPVLKNQALEVLVIKENTKSGKEFLKILHELTKLNNKHNSEFEIRNLLSQAWLILMEEIKIQKEKDTTIPNLNYLDRAQSILSFIHKNYSGKITLADMSKSIGISTKECLRSFKNTFHQTPMEYLVNYRIERAKQLLKESDYSITDIAFKTGFNNSAYFSKLFKKYTSVTPKSFRKNHFSEI